MSQSSKRIPYTVTITNKRIYNYYSENPNINIETMNLILLDFMEQLGTDMTKILVNSTLGDVLTHVKELKQHVTTFNDGLVSRISDTNKTFITSITQLIENTSLRTNADKLELLNGITQSFVDKINGNIPKTCEDINKTVQSVLDVFHKNITSDIKSILNTDSSSSSVKEFISNFETKLMTLQQPMYTFLSTSHDQLSSKLTTIREDAITTKPVTDRLMNELGEFLNKYKTSSQYKGVISETQLGMVLTKMFPTAEVTNTTALKACGDFFLKRAGKQSILIENKNYEANVNLDEIVKFLRDVNEHKMNGIMISQKSGIVSKPNGFIEINDGKVLVYLHNVEYSPDKIQMAIDVIDNLSERLEETINMDGIVSIKKDVVDKINDQFNKFISQREVITTMMRDTTKKLVGMIDDMEMPDLSLFLKDKYASIQNQQHMCDICSQIFTTKRALGSHAKVHRN